MTKELNFFPFTDERICYLGRWQPDGKGAIVSYGTVSFVKTAFLGDCIGVCGTTDRAVEIIIDGKNYPTHLDGTVYFDMPFGLHTLTIRVSEFAETVLRGFYTQEIAAVAQKEQRPYLKFIGDSITCFFPGYSAATAEYLQVDYSVDAVGGMSLTEGWGWFPPERRKTGMENYYFKTGRGGHIGTEDYRFEFDRDPNAVVVFLGTNDYLDKEADEKAGNIEIFAEHYAAFVQKLAKQYANASFYILEPLSDKYCRQRGIEAGFARMKELLGDRVELVPSHTWGVELCEDGTHPSDRGNANFAYRLACLLQPKLFK